ncbi:MAG: DUF5362 family protein [Fusobacteria bacterium]|nr:DUF5362 family protein [Fusobacteriota bacterium]
MNKLNSAIKWGKFNAIIGMIGSVIAILGCISLPVGIIMLIGFMKLNNATDELKALAAKAGSSAEDYENVIEKYGNYLKMLGIANIINIVMAVLGVIFYVVFFGFIMSLAGGSGNYNY